MAKAKAKNERDEKPETGDQKKKALEMALSKIEKDFGKGTVMKLGESPTMEIGSVSTGSLNLDIALGIGA